MIYFLVQQRYLTWMGEYTKWMPVESYENAMSLVNAMIVLNKLKNSRQTYEAVEYRIIPK